jgi:hypothetical protein
MRPKFDFVPNLVMLAGTGKQNSLMPPGRVLCDVPQARRDNSKHPSLFPSAGLAKMPARRLCGAATRLLFASRGHARPRIKRSFACIGAMPASSKGSQAASAPVEGESCLVGCLLGSKSADCLKRWRGRIHEIVGIPQLRRLAIQHGLSGLSVRGPESPKGNIGEKTELHGVDSIVAQGLR